MKKGVIAFTVATLVASGLIAGKQKRPTVKPTIKNKVTADPTGCILEDIKGSGIGDVKYSILSETDFQAVHGDEWVLLKGQNFSELSYGSYDTENDPTIESVVNSGPYESTTKLPDASGKFLRARNTDSVDTSQNPEGYKNIGEPELDRTKMPNQPFVTGAEGGHSHDIARRGNGAGSPQGIAIGDGNTFSDDTTSVSSEPDHTHIISGGDIETRPRNVTLNAFVKIRLACINPAILDQLRSSYCGPADTVTYANGCFGLPESDNAERSAKLVCLKAALEEWENQTIPGKNWSSGCLMQVVGTSKRVLIDMAQGKSNDELAWFNTLIEQYPHYNAIQIPGAVAE